MAVLSNSTVILLTVAVTPVLYVAYNLLTFLLAVRRRAKAVNQFPGEPTHWLWGHLHLNPGPNEAGLAWVRELTGKYPLASTMWRGPVDPVLQVRHPKTIKPLLTSSEPKPLGIGVYRYAQPWIGDGLLVSKGKKWARNRRLLTPAFHFDILKPYTVINNEASERLMYKIAKYAERGESFEFYGNVSLCTFDVILRCAMSYEDDIQGRGENHPYVQSVKEMGELWTKRVFRPWLASDFVYYLTSQGRTFKKHCDFAHSISENLIKKRQETLNVQGADAMRKGRYLDFLDILLSAKDADGRGLSFQEIRDEVDTFLFEGHDTTASSISWAIYSIAENQEWQRKCQEEIDGILKGRDSDVIEWDDFPKLKYVTMCIKESMRLHCPVPLIERQLTKEMEIDGKLVSPGSVLSISLYSIHHNPAIWDNPMDFQPERFSSENVGKKDTYSFVPFSAGPRNCIGQHFAMFEQKVVLSRILRRFHIELDPNFKVEKQISVVMRTERGMKLKVTPRQIR